MPGATTSGLMRPSAAGPQLEKPAMLLGLSPSSSLSGRLFSLAPMVSTFLAVPGAPTVCAVGPALPATR